MNIGEIMRLAPVIPVLVIDDPSLARPAAEALVKGGLRALEVTLRTPAALEVIAEMRKVEGAKVGAGTVLNPHDVRRAIDAGAEFIVSPGLTDAVGKEAAASGTPFLPGVATSSDIMRALDLGLNHVKFFPAAAAGGIAALKALAGPFYELRVCPTGGVTLDNGAEWLAIEQVVCVGGTWLSPRNADMKALESAARRAASI